MNYKRAIFSVIMLIYCQPSFARYPQFAITGYLSLHWSSKNIVDIGGSIMPGVKFADRGIDMLNYIDYVDIGLLNKIAVGINGIEYGLGLATLNPLLGLGVYSQIFYPYLNKLNIRNTLKYKNGFDTNCLYLGYGITGSFLLNVNYERYYKIGEINNRFNSYSIGFGF